MTLEDSARTVQLYAAVDLYTAPPPNSPPLNYPYAGNLLRQIAPFADLMAAAIQGAP